MNQTQAKVQRNLAGLEFLLSRPDTRDMLPQSKELDKSEASPAFYVCRAIMRDNLTVICISLRVTITTYADGSEQYTHRDIHGRGTTFEMALFDLSAQLIKLIGDNDVIDTESIPIIQERLSHESRTDKSIWTDKPDTAKSSVNTAQQDERKGMATRSNNTSGSGPARKHTRSKPKSATGSGRGGRSKRPGR